MARFTSSGPISNTPSSRQSKEYTRGPSPGTSVASTITSVSPPASVNTGGLRVMAVITGGRLVTSMSVKLPPSPPSSSVTATAQGKARRRHKCGSPRRCLRHRPRSQFRTPDCRRPSLWWRCGCPRSPVDESRQGVLELHPSSACRGATGSTRGATLIIVIVWVVVSELPTESSITRVTSVYTVVGVDVVYTCLVGGESLQANLRLGRRFTNAVRGYQCVRRSPSRS